MNTLVCAVVKTIGLFVGVVLFACFMNWLVENVSPSTFMNFWMGLFCIGLIGCALIGMYESCEASNKKNTTTNQTVKKTTSTQDVKPTKQYPVLGEIQKIISNLIELEKNQDLDKDLFVEFHVLKDKFNSDYQEIVKMLNTLGEIDQFDDNHLKPFNHYLDAFKKQQQIIYGNIKQQYNDKLNTISEQLQHFN